MAGTSVIAGMSRWRQKWQHGTVGLVGTILEMLMTLEVLEMLQGCWQLAWPGLGSLQGPAKYEDGDTR